MSFIFFTFLFVQQPPSANSLEGLLNGNPEVAEKALLMAVDDQKTEAQASLLLCKLYTDQNNYEKALPYGKKAVELLPEVSDAHYFYAVAIRQKMSKNTMFGMSHVGKYKKLLDQAIELDRNNLDAYEEKIGFLMNAPPIAGGSKEKAEALAKELLEINKERGLVQLWTVYESNPQPEKRAEVASELIALKPDNVRYQFFMGFSLQGQNKNKEAAQYFEGIYEQDQNELGALYQMARSRILGDFQLEKAIAYLDEYIEKANEKTQPSIAAAHWRAGVAHEKLDQKDLARSRYQSALKADPKFSEAKKALKKLK